MEKKIAYIGIDCHSETLSPAVIVDEKKDFFDSITMKNNDKIILKF
ncbi:MAG: hypothetical protein KKF00_11580 [Proteobacteria bacterium]|nr:hypothetical protein [Pseudomonadota bacterium]